MPVTIKLGPHSITPTADALRLVEAGASIALLLDDFGQAAEMTRLGALVIGRSFQGEFDARWQYTQGQDPVTAARNFVFSSRQKPIYQLNPQIKVWTGHNEFNPATIAEMVWYAAFEVERIRLLAAMGLRACIGNFAVGNPPLDLWPAFYPAIREAILQDGILGIHEYAALWMWWMTGAYQINPDEDEGDEGWTTLRYRKALRSFPPELRAVKIVITETGLDLVSPPPLAGANGNWRNCIGWWNNDYGGGDPIGYWEGDERDPEVYYAEQLIWYEKELRKDKSVIGAAIFTLGTNNSAWEDFRVDETRVIDRLVRYAENAAPIEPPIEPPEEIPPMTTILNPSFEKGWTDKGPEQQQANGWTLTQTPPGERMGVPTKQSGGNVVDALAAALQEVVHKLFTQLPENERLGQPRALILDGSLCLKLFWGLASESKLSTVITGTPGKQVRVRVPVLGESNLTGPLEDDTFWVTVKLGSAVERRNYAEMVSQFAVMGNERHWNIFSVEGTFPADGRLTLTITLQDNWGRTDFFIDNITLEEITDGNGTPLPTDDSLIALATNLVAAAHALAVRLQDVADGVEMIEAGARQVAEALGASETP